LLSDLPTFDREGVLRVVIETPRGSRNKYDFDPELNCMELGAVLPRGMSFPFDFGFIPSTLGQDGDPLDVLALLDAPVIAGCTLSARLIGVIEARQKEKKGAWFRNDRLLVVAKSAQSHAAVNELQDMKPHLLGEIKSFFIDYNRSGGRIFEPLADRGPKAARRLIDVGQKAYNTKSATTQPSA
jgi:inorganic pyrophosphatase